MRLAPNRVPDADGLYLVTRSGPPVEEGGDMRDGSPGVDPLDPLGRPEAALELPGCPACRALPSLEAELVGWFVTQSLADGDGRHRLYAAGGLCGRHWRAVANEEVRRRHSMMGTAQVLAEVLARRSTQGEVPVACPICEDLEASAANRLYLLLTKLGPAALPAASGAPAAAAAGALARPLGGRTGGALPGRGAGGRPPLRPHARAAPPPRGHRQRGAGPARRARHAHRPDRSLRRTAAPPSEDRGHRNSV